jgi:1-acyl-sn-glycerol-3-phosphate acyltransferase
MLVLRSLAFNVAFYMNLVVWLIAILPTIVLPRRALIATVKGWGRSNLILMRLIVGTRMEVRGRDRIPKGALLVAAKHQSFWETFALLHLFDDPCYVLKRELMWIPFFGWYLRKARMIPVDRGARSAALKAMNLAAADEIAAGRQILIFPEGTRRAPGAEPAYKYGIAFLYDETKAPCLPVALNSGVFWPRRRFIRRPGTIVIEIGEPIEPGLDKATFFERLREDIERRTERLIAEARASVGQDELAKEELANEPRAAGEELRPGG